MSHPESHKNERKGGGEKAREKKAQDVSDRAEPE